MAYRLENFMSEKLEEAYNVGYEQGLEDAWEYARQLTDMNPFELGQLLNKDTAFETDIINNLSSQEAIKRLEEFNSEATGEIRIGDEVIAKEMGRIVVTQVGDDGFIQGFDAKGNQYYAWIGSCTKTNRHFGEIEQMFKELRGEK